MARIRTIKPSFFTSLTITGLTYEQRLTFIGLWTHVDDEGRCEYDPRLLKAAVWPIDSRSADDIQADVDALSEAGLVTHYEVASRSYLSVNGWLEHQRINRPRQSEYPAPTAGQEVPLACTNEQFTESSVNAHGGLSEGSLRERKGKEGNKEGNGVARKRATQLPDAWQPTSSHHALASELGVRIEHEAPKFVDYCHANGKAYKDPDRAFNNWLRNAKQFQQQRSGRRGDIDWDAAMERARAADERTGA